MVKEVDHDDPNGHTARVLKYVWDVSIFYKKGFLTSVKGFCSW